MGSSTPSLSIKSMKHSFDKLCGPAKFYLIISIIGSITYIVNIVDHTDKLKSGLSMVIHGLCVVVLTWFFNLVCTMKHGHAVAWFLLFIPIIIFTLLLIFSFYMIDKMDMSKEDIQRLMKEAKDDKEDDIEGLKNSC